MAEVKTLSQFLGILNTKGNMSLRDIARKLGMEEKSGRTVVYQWLKKNRIPSMRYALKLNKLLGVPFELMHKDKLVK